MTFDLRVDGDAPAYRMLVGEFARECGTPEEIATIWASGTVHDARVHKAAAARGWIGASWPESAGGSGLHPVESGALWEALNYHQLPVDIWELTEMAAWVVLHRGTDEQRSRVLPAVRSGDHLMALGYSEPDAGSDVAAASTQARKDGDRWVIRGAKIFTTGAHVADEVLLLARTNPEVAKHRGLSMFLVPLHDPRIDIQPIHTFGGERTNAVFFDDVEVPLDAVVGDVDDGWSVLNLGLDFERSMMGTYVGRGQRVLDELLAALRSEGGLTSGAMEQLAALNVRLEAARVLCDDVACRIATGRPISVGAAMAKLVATEAFKDIAYLALDLLGARGLTHERLAPELLPGSLEHWFRHSQIATIYGGSNEIQRNIVSQHELRLPRG